MSKTSNQIKSELLGIPWGTANGRMRKMLIWHLVTKFELGSCYRCDEKINTIEELSIEHKEAWQSADDPIEVFYDMENITFSHLYCNIGHTNRSKTKCKYGHPYNKENTYIKPSNGERDCNICKIQRKLNPTLPSKKLKYNN